MRIGATSDTHGELPETGSWPDFELFIHAGDAGPSPSFTEADRDLQRRWYPSFVEWLDAIPARDKIFVPGNHDLFMQDDVGSLPTNVAVLKHARMERLRLFGSAWNYWDKTIFAPPWAFGADEPALERLFAQIPVNTEILVCHSGARGILDNAPGREVGSTSLKRRVVDLVNLRLFIHGHAHESSESHLRIGAGLWVNAAERIIDMEWSGEPESSVVRTLGRTGQAQAEGT